MRIIVRIKYADPKHLDPGLMLVSANHDCPGARGSCHRDLFCSRILAQVVSHWKGLRGKCSIPRRSGQMNVPEVHFTEIYEIYEKV